MALYLMNGRDKPDSLELRKATRPSHLEWIGSLGARVKVGGPVNDVDGGPPVGSMIVIEADSLDHARATFDEDPYAKAGLWASLEVRPFTWVTI